MVREHQKKEVFRMLAAIGGSFLFALGANVFIVPMGFYNGGILDRKSVV